MTYLEAVRFLNSLVNYEKIPKYTYKNSLKLERIEEFLDIIDNPQHGLRCIHIVGTKGKGSTAAFIAYILREAQYKVGLYSSPHLSDFRERIRILDLQTTLKNQPAGTDNLQLNQEFEGMIPCQRLANLVESLKPKIKQYNYQSKYGPLSFFEVYTALTYKYFKDENVDFAILEAGLGGRLDATNTADSLVAAITPISYDHTRQLGSTLSEIAREKAGIIKNKKLIVVNAAQEKVVEEIIKDKCKQKGALLYEFGKEIVLEIRESHSDCQCFNINGIFGRIDDLSIRLFGRHQLINATLALAVVLILNKFYKTKIEINAIRRGLYNTLWPGRFEIISREPLIILDGAHNPASAQALRETIIENFPSRRVILILGISKDKDIKGVCKTIFPISSEVILTQSKNPRAADVDDIGRIVGGSTIRTRRIGEALEIAKKMARSQDLILITGSLFLVGEARQIQNRNSLLKSPHKNKILV